MSVDVTLLPATIPHQLREEDVSRRREMRDRGDTAYRYSIHTSGALVIWRATGDQAPEVDSVLGPSAWEEVQGDLLVSLV